MAECKINAGICGFETIVTVTSEDAQEAVIGMSTQCPSLKPLEQQPLTVDGFEVCFGKVGEGKIYGWCKEYCIHAACPVPSGIIKAVEVACELALPKDATIEISK